MRKSMEEWFDMKVKAVLGPDPKDDREVAILGRCVRCVEDGLGY